MTVIFCVTNNTHCTFLKYFGTMNDRFARISPNKQSIREVLSRYSDLVMLLIGWNQLICF